MNSNRQPTLAIIGSIAGSILVSTIAIATVIVLQHGSMRSDMRDQHAALRSDMRDQHTALRSDTGELRSDIGELRSDVGELRERVARIEVIVERSASDGAEPAVQ